VRTVRTYATRAGYGHHLVRKSAPLRPLQASNHGNRTSQTDNLGRRQVKDLIAAIEVLIDAWNERCQPFVWTKTADQITPKTVRGQATSIARH
jgi:hypothetical protein